MLAYFDVHLAGFSATTRAGPPRPPSRLMPRGNAVSIGSVDSGQSMVRVASTASLLSFHNTRVQASANCEAASTIAVAASAPYKNLCFNMFGLQMTADDLSLRRMAASDMRADPRAASKLVNGDVRRPNKIAAS